MQPLKLRTLLRLIDDTFGTSNTYDKLCKIEEYNCLKIYNIVPKTILLDNKKFELWPQEGTIHPFYFHAPISLPRHFCESTTPTGCYSLFYARDVKVRERTNRSLLKMFDLNRVRNEFYLHIKHHYETFNFPFDIDPSYVKYVPPVVDVIVVEMGTYSYLVLHCRETIGSPIITFTLDHSERYGVFKDSRVTLAEGRNGHYVWAKQVNDEFKFAKLKRNGHFSYV